MHGSVVYQVQEMRKWKGTISVQKQSPGPVSAVHAVDRPGAAVDRPHTDEVLDTIYFTTAGRPALHPVDRAFCARGRPAKGQVDRAN